MTDKRCTFNYIIKQIFSVTSSKRLLRPRLRGCRRVLWEYYGSSIPFSNFTFVSLHKSKHVSLIWVYVCVNLHTCCVCRHLPYFPVLGRIKNLVFPFPFAVRWWKEGFPIFYVTSTRPKLQNFFYIEWLLRE